MINETITLLIFYVWMRYISINMDIITSRPNYNSKCPLEWGQISIMDFLVNYVPADSKEAET